ncbi:50S ribosomal protein L9 [Candidatus Dependentiae bacterium]|nr:50S ribosomal protein L9 [Candidatus Dependentiae bacterium]
MKVYLLKDIAKVGFAGEIIKVSDGYAKNFILPQKLGVEVTTKNQLFYESKVKNVEHRKEALSSEQSMLSEKISHLKLTLKRKLHDDDRLYASVSAGDIVDLLDAEHIKISKNQVIFEKTIKKTGDYKIVIKLSSKLMPQIHLKVLGL